METRGQRNIKLNPNTHKTVAFVSSNSTSSTNGAVNTAHGATTISTQANVVNSTTIDNLKMDLMWHMAMLTMRARIFLKNTRRKLIVNGNFMPPKPDFSFSGLEEFVNEPIVSEPTVKKPVVETSEAKASADKPKVVRKNNGALIIEDWVSESEEEDVPRAKIKKKTVKPSFAKIEFVKPKGKTVRKTAKQVEQLRQNTHTPRGNQ
ncbi:hypothetical protein Tco_1501171 [Tanacetum coccineum]